MNSLHFAQFALRAARGNGLERNAKYQRLLDAVYDEDAVEGSLTADNLLAAQMIRFCDMERRPSGRCGPDGKNWEPVAPVGFV